MTKLGLQTSLRVLPAQFGMSRKALATKFRAGEILAVVDAQAIGQAKGELIDALVQESLQQKTTERLRGPPEGVVAGRKILEAEAEFETCQRVRVLASTANACQSRLKRRLDELASLPHRGTGCPSFGSWDLEEPQSERQHAALRRPISYRFGRRWTASSSSETLSPGEVVDSAKAIVQDRRH